MFWILCPRIIYHYLHACRDNAAVDTQSRQMTSMNALILFNLLSFGSTSWAMATHYLGVSRDDVAVLTTVRRWSTCKPWWCRSVYHSPDNWLQRMHLFSPISYLSDPLLGLWPHISYHYLCACRDDAAVDTTVPTNDFNKCTYSLQSLIFCILWPRII